MFYRRRPAAAKTFLYGLCNIHYLGRVGDVFVGFCVQNISKIYKRIMIKFLERWSVA